MPVQVFDEPGVVKLYDSESDDFYEIDISGIEEITQVPHCLRTGMHLEFVVNIFDMGLHRVRAEEQPGSDGAVVYPLAEQGKLAGIFTRWFPCSSRGWAGRVITNFLK